MQEKTNNVDKLTDHLFRHESGKMVAVLTRLFGFHNADLVEDVVQEAFAKALHEWPFRMPGNPSAWLYQVARNKAIDVVRRLRYQKEFAEETTALLRSEYTASPVIDNLFLDHEIRDSQLRMIFACCHHALDEADQLALMLKTCSGFSVSEIAAALLVSPDAVKKRLQRARALLAENKIRLEIPTGNTLRTRLDVVLHGIYLLFNEGYNSSSKEHLIRKDLCEEAVRLAHLLTEYPLTNTPKCYALVALQCLLSSRFEARQDENAEIILLEDQDRTKWNSGLIQLGLSYLERSMKGDELTEYHLQAAIVAEHSIALSFADTNWARILWLYDMLLAQYDTPVIRLNRAVVLSKTANPQKAIETIMEIPGIDHLLASHYLFSAVLGEMYAQKKDREKAMQFFRRAETLTQSQAEKKLLRRKLESFKP